MCPLSDLPTSRVISQDRKYFDSGDYALSKAGKAPQNTVGTTIPSPEKYASLIVCYCRVAHKRLYRSIPHANSPPVSHTLSSSPTNNSATSPIKESPLADPDRAAFQEAEPALVAEGAATETSAMPVEAEAEDKAE